MSNLRVMLATSAQRPEYMRDFLTCLASPDGHRVAFSYQKGWFAEKLLGAELVGREAVIVFCDAKTSRSNFEFLPVRHVYVEEVVPAAPTGLRDVAAITVVFRLDSLIAVTDERLPALRAALQASLENVDHRPRPTGHRDKDKALFVFEHPGLPEREAEPNATAAWRVLSEELGRSRTLKDAFFFRVGELRRASEGAAGKALATEQVGSVRRVYLLTPSAEYELPMDAYSKSGKTPYSNAIDVTSSSEQLTVQAITQSSAGRASKAVLVLRAGEVKRAQIATLIIQGAKDFEHLVPRVELATQIKPKRLLAVALTIFIALGVLAGGLPMDAFGLPDGVIYALKGFGGLVVGVGTLLGLGRVAGVGK